MKLGRTLSTDCSSLYDDRRLHLLEFRRKVAGKSLPLFISSEYRDCYAPLPRHRLWRTSAGLQSRLSACGYGWCPQESYADSFHCDPRNTQSLEVGEDRIHGNRPSEQPLEFRK